MLSVLAIESYRGRAAVLREVITKHTHAHLRVVDSVDAAMAAIDQRVPEVILVSPLMTPQDDARLTERLRALPKAAHVQTLIMPLLARPVEPQPRRGWDRFKLGSAPKPPGPPVCDRAAFADQLKTYLEQVRDRRLDLAAPAQPRDSDRRSAMRVANVDRVKVIIDGSSVNLIDLSMTGAQILSPALLVTGRLVPVVLENRHETVSCQASIVWGAFDFLPSTRVLRYRAGVDWKDADRQFLEKLCAPQLPARCTTLDAPQSFDRVQLSQT